jgi:starch phosphorylase
LNQLSAHSIPASCPLGILSATLQSATDRPAPAGCHSAPFVPPDHELPAVAAPGNDPASLREAIGRGIVYGIGKPPEDANAHDRYRAIAGAVRERLVERWIETQRLNREQQVKRVYFLSMEFLVGRSLRNAVQALELEPALSEALGALGASFEEAQEQEPDAALGNGGLGRLAACFLDSMATLGLPSFGYGIRYDYGMFAQHIHDGYQVEQPDDWLAHGNPWEFARPETTYPIRFGGWVRHDGGQAEWVDTEHVLAMAYDMIVPGYGTRAVSTLRLWHARASEALDLSLFNQGDYMRAVRTRNLSENVTRVLYPDDSSYQGRELRLRQEYFFVSASLQDILTRYMRDHHDFGALPDRVAIHLNDTHPAIAVPELVRLLVDVHRLELVQAWELARRIFSYTNHTLMPEALETWPVQMMASVLPRHLELVFAINQLHLDEVRARAGDDPALVARMSLIDESGERRVRMAHLSVAASHQVNGVSKLHSELVRSTLFADFAQLWPERFCNKTNGITPRRWLAGANPGLAALVDARIGPGWRTDLDQLGRLAAFADDPQLLSALGAVKAANKDRLARWLVRRTGVVVDPASLFDVQVNRMHEYKRQLLNVLHVVARYLAILERPDGDWVPRTVIFSGKAASAYRAAKLVIKLINDVALVVNHDARVNRLLKVVFIPNYGVSVAEVVIPAADLSEQISTAGTEASGTGNMKFALNGALTIGTLDGANIEIRDAVGPDNFFLFGLTAEGVARLRSEGYDPASIIARDAALRHVLEAIGGGLFAPEERDRFVPLVDALARHGDHYCLVADFASYLGAQAEVDRVFKSPVEWQRRALLNIAGMGPFSSDRAIREYAEQIWRVRPVAR